MIYGRILIFMYSREHKLYLRKKKIRKILVIFTQILLAVLLISIWELLATYKVINTFITSSPSRVLSTIISLYNDNNLFNNIWNYLEKNGENVRCRNCERELRN